MHHRVDGGAHELGWIVGDTVLEPLGHGLGYLAHGAAHLVGDLQCVGARCLVDADADRRLVIEFRAHRVVGRPELDTGDVTQVRHRAAAARLDDDVAKLLHALQPTPSIDGELQLGTRQRRRPADHPGRRLNVLLTQRRHHIAGRKATGGDLVGIKPDPHGIFPTAKDGHVPHPLDPGQSVTHIEQRIIALVVDVITILR
ncbi:hypothetical protein D3C76_191640 [compost metagenome]